jgi:excisionase family DNA binding protein
MGEWLTLEQVAEYLQMSNSAIYKLAQKSKIPGHKVGRQWRFKKEEIDDWVEKSKGGLKIVNNEKELTELLYQKLQESNSFKEIKAHINLASRKFYSHWKKWYKSSYFEPSVPPPAQPEIDLLLVDSRFQLFGVEIKHMIPKGETFNQSFYAGVGEAIALLRFGFKCVSLWHCFEISATEPAIWGYRDATQKLIYSLSLPINYNALKLIEREQKVDFLDITNTIDFSKAPMPSFGSLPYGLSNPLCDKDDEVERNEDFLRNILNIPHEE